VALICNLVQEFNGLVSKGSTVMLAFLLLKKSTIFTPPFLTFFFVAFDQKNMLAKSLLSFQSITYLKRSFITFTNFLT
jgi:hypothetical protein